MLSISSSLTNTYAIVDVDPPDYTGYFSISGDSGVGVFACSSLEGADADDPPLSVVVVASAANADGEDKATVVFDLEGPPAEAGEDPPAFDQVIYDDKELEENYGTDASCYSVSADSDTPVTYSELDVSPADYDGYFEVDPSGTFTCTELPAAGQLTDTDRVTVVVQAANDGGTDEATVVFTLLGGGDGGDGGEEPEFEEPLYETDLEEDYATIPGCLTVAVTPASGEVTYSVLEVSPPEYEPYFQVSDWYAIKQ